MLQLEEAYAKIEDLENRSRRYNFRIRSVSVSVNHIDDAAQFLMHSALQDADNLHLEIERTHKALIVLKPAGPPRDIIVKQHFYRTKEAVMHYARDNPELEFQEHKKKKSIFKPCTYNDLNEKDLKTSPTTTDFSQYTLLLDVFYQTLIHL